MAGREVPDSFTSMGTSPTSVSTTKSTSIPAYPAPRGPEQRVHGTTAFQPLFVKRAAVRRSAVSRGLWFRSWPETDFAFALVRNPHGCSQGTGP